MTEIAAVVPTEGVRNTGRISYQFLFDAHVPRTFYSTPFGALSRHRKGDDYLNPFKLARGEPGAVGDDGTPCWALNVYSKGALLVGSGVDSVEGEPGLQEMLKDVPECIVLVPPQDIEPVEFVCASLGHTLTILRHEGELSTS